MDLTTLTVFNSIHKLGITKNEFDDIAREQKEDHSGIYVATVRKRHAIIVSHDEKSRIVIKKIKGITKFPCRILLKTLITFTDVPEEVYLLHRIGKYKALDLTIKHAANNMEELKERVLERFTDGYPQELGGEYDDVYGDSAKRKVAKKKKPELIIKQLKALYWLFGEVYDGKEIPSRFNVAKIIKAWQGHNKRTALFQENENWRMKRGMLFYDYIDKVTYKIKTYTPKDKEYNYVCPGREVGLSGNPDYKEIWLSDELLGKVTAEDMEIIQALKNDIWFITPDNLSEMQSSIRRARTDVRMVEEEKEAKEILLTNINKQFSKGKVVRRGITFTPNSFSYEGITIKGEMMDKYLVAKNIVTVEEPNFNVILDNYIEYLLEVRIDYNYYPHDKETCFFRGERKLQIGKAKIKLFCEKGKFRVNEFRIRKDECEEILKRAINYKSQKDYDSFLEETSKVSLKLQGILSKGRFEFGIALGDNDDCELELEREMVIAVPVIREDKNYIIVRGEKFKITNVQSFLNLDLEDGRSMWRFEGSPLQKLIVRMNKAVDISPEHIGYLITDGMKEFKKKRLEEERINKEKTKRSEEFLAHAVKLTNATKIKGEYRVKGLSGTYYTVNSSSHAVYKGKEYLCIVDDHTDTSTAWGNNDAVAKRLLMLSKDVKVASEIFSRGDGMDKWWNQIKGVQDDSNNIRSEASV